MTTRTEPIPMLLTASAASADPRLMSDAALRSLLDDARRGYASERDPRVLAARREYVARCAASLRGGE